MKSPIATSSPESTPPDSRLSRPKHKLLWILVGLALVAAIVVARKIAFSNAPQLIGPDERAQINPAGAVVLSDFAQPETRRWHTVPRGTQVCDRVTFICDGAIRTAGVSAARDGNHYPGAVLGVAVNRRGARIHLLQAAENCEGMTEGAPYGRLVLHYENGDTWQIELLFGIHGEDWLAKGNGRDPVADPNTRPAWVQKRSGDGVFIRLYHTALENPLPEYAITSVDFISPLREANLLLFGLTIDDDPRLLSPSYGAVETLMDPGIERLVFNLRDSTAQPAPDARLAWTLQGSRLRIDFPSFAANGQGQVIVETPRRYVRQIVYKASASDGSHAEGMINLRDVSITNVVLKLERVPR